MYSNIGKQAPVLSVVVSHYTSVFISVRWYSHSETIFSGPGRHCGQKIYEKFRRQAMLQDSWPAFRVSETGSTSWLKKFVSLNTNSSPNYVYSQAESCPNTLGCFNKLTGIITMISWSNATNATIRHHSEATKESLCFPSRHKGGHIYHSVAEWSAGLHGRIVSVGIGFALISGPSGWLNSIEQITNILSHAKPPLFCWWPPIYFSYTPCWRKSTSPVKFS